MKGAEGGGHKRRRRSRRRSQPMAEINVTPFVDVMLVLLIIFMVAAPLLTVGVPVELPKTAANPLPGEQEEPLAVTIAADGTLSIMNSPVAAERESQRIYLRADGALPYEIVVQVMGALNAAGFADIGLVTDIGGPDLGDN
jgi:biopolymer transport protein TolR